MNDMPTLSFGFVENQPSKPSDPNQPVRVIRDVKLLYLSLDLWPSVYQLGASPESQR